jgi:hypothetical protein
MVGHGEMQMAKDRKKVSIQYRKLGDPTNGFKGETLQKVLTRACETGTGNVGLGADPSKRQCTDNAEYGTLLLNYFDPQDKFFFGEIVRFEPGADLPLVNMRASAKSYNLTQAKAPEGHEAIRGLYYFMAIGDHVLVLEGDLSSSRAEKYLTWLLKDKAKLVADSTQLFLDAEIQAQTADMQLKEIETVVLRPRPISESTAEVVERTTGQARLDVSGTNTFEVLRAAGFDETGIHNLIENKTDVQLTLELKFKSERRRQALKLDDASRLLRNVPDDELTLVGPGGRQKGGRLVKLAHPAQIKLIGSLLETQDVARALYEAYSYFLNNGYIE